MIWSACERFGIKPPGIRDTWDEMGSEEQADLIAYNQVAEYEESKRWHV